MNRNLLKLFGPDAAQTQWHTSAGEPVLAVKAKDGTARAPTLRDARKEGFIPSVSTVLTVVDRGGSAAWAIRDGIAAAIAAPRRPSESAQDHVERVTVLAEHKRTLAMAIGSVLRREVAQMAMDCKLRGDKPAAPTPELAGVAEWMAEKVPVILAASPVFVNQAAGYAGGIAFAAPHVDHGLVLVSVHSYLEAPDKPQPLWCWELAAARAALGYANAKGLTLGITVGSQAAPTEHLWSYADLDEGWVAFRAAHTVWRTLKGYDPRQVVGTAREVATC